MHLQYFRFHLFAPPLFRTARNGNVDRLKNLLETGSEVNICERDGLTPLMVASLRGNGDVVELLVQHGAAVNAKENKGMTALLFASMNYKKILHAIKNYFNGWRVRTLENMSTLGGNIKYPVIYYPAFYDTYTAVAKILVLNGADVNASDANADTPLVHAAFAGNERMVELFLLNGTDVNAKNKDGATPLMASLSGFSSINIVKMLIERGADVNAADNDGMPVTAFASIKKNQEIMQLLRDKGAKGEIIRHCRTKTL
jgi:ankyrin repeat protein